MRCARAGLVLLAAGHVLAAPPSSASPPPGSASPAVDASARLPAGDRATESWDLLGVFDSGHRIAARFTITNAGPGDRNALVVGYVRSPDGRTHLWDNGRRRARWTLSADRLEIEVGSSRLALRPPAYALDIDKDHLKLALRFVPRGAERAPLELLPADYALELLGAALRVEGSFALPGAGPAVPLRGRLTLVHSWSEAAEADVALRRIDAFAHDGSQGVVLVDLEGADGTRRTWLHVRRDDRPILSTARLRTTPAGRARHAEAQRYWVPGSLSLEGPELRGEVVLGEAFASQDPFEWLPLPIALVMRLFTQPRDVWLRTRFDLRLAPDGASPKTVRGDGIALVRFLNPLPAPQAEP